MKNSKLEKAFVAYDGLSVIDDGFRGRSPQYLS